MKHNNQQNYNHLQLHNGSYKKSKSNKSPKYPKLVRNIAVLISLVLIVTTIVYYRALTYSHSASSSTRGCDLFSGEWVRDYSRPYYTNETCSAIHEHQNCMKYGRSDTDFFKWRWKPDGCELPAFNPNQFLELVRGKKMAFVGDSVARNQMQSLMCLLSGVENPIDKSYTSDFQFKRWKYTSHNFLLAIFWTPFLVKWREPSPDPNRPENMGIYSLYLDEFDSKWTWQAAEFDYLILSAGHWFHRPMIYYEKGTIVGCQFCSIPNITELDMLYAYRRAFRTAFRAVHTISRLKHYKGVTFLRTFAPSHFENGTWDRGGNCARTRPFGRGEAVLEGADLETYVTQLEEFRAAEREGLRFRLLNTTQATLLRPDGHPSRYGHPPDAKVVLYNDCVHWCLPGPIDTWNDFLFQMLKDEEILNLKEGRKGDS